MFNLMVSSEVRERIEELELPFNRYGLDLFGISKDSLAVFYTFLGRLYRHYFKVKSFGNQYIPPRGRTMMIGNHSGGLPVDAGMVIASLFFETTPPRHAHGMVELFAQHWPFVSRWFNRAGAFPGLPEHAIRLLENDRVLLVFPEGARGTGKLYKDRYQMVRFGTGFMRIAISTKTPIVPFAFIGGEEALPTIYHAKTLARFFGSPYWPVPPYLIPMPLPRPCEIHYGPPMFFEGSGNERDRVIQGYVDQVREKIEELIEQGRDLHLQRLAGKEVT